MVHSFVVVLCTSYFFQSFTENDVNVWDEGPDSSHNIRFDKKNPALVTGATFNKLVERMTSEKDHGKC